MKKLLCTILLVLMLVASVTTYVYADDGMSFYFDLSVDGSNQKQVKTGDVITVVFKLEREDSTEPYTMYAMQEEIHYDGDFFELVEGSVVSGDGIVTTDIAMVDNYREFYMNYLSMSGGAQWDASSLIGSIQLRVIADTGVTKITSSDYLVSFQDGQGSYPCEAGEVTIILSTECIVSFMTSGGSQIEDQVVQYGEHILRPENPTRSGYRFAGWYKDINLTQEWDFENDTVESNMALYARWEIAEESAVGGGSGLSGSNASGVYWLIWLLLLLALLLVLLLIILLLRRRKKDDGEEEDEKSIKRAKSTGRPDQRKGGKHIKH